MGARNYEVSDRGRVRTRRYVDEFSGEWLVLSAGYPCVEVVYDDSRARSSLVHRLVALAFLGPQPSPDHVVGHLNDVPTLNVLVSAAAIRSG